MITMYNVVSADGFISKLDRSEDFIPDEMWEEFLSLCQEYGSVIMGRKTYDAVQKYDSSLVMKFEALHIKRVVVSRDANFEPKNGYVVARSPKEAYMKATEALTKMNKRGEKEVLLCSGPTLNTSILKEGMIDTVILEKLPVRLGDGLKPFDEDEVKSELKLISKEDKGGGRERCIYSVAYIGPVDQTEA